jgi:hypothetical protein
VKDRILYAVEWFDPFSGEHNLSNRYLFTDRAEAEKYAELCRAREEQDYQHRVVSLVLHPSAL